MPLVSGFDTHDLVARICREPGGYSWQLLNRKIALRELAVSGAEFNPAIRDRKRLRFVRDLLFGNRWLVDELTRNSEDIVQAATLPDLVLRMNALNGDDVVDLGAVESAVSAYDGAIRRGERFHHNDEQLRRIAWLRRWPADRLRTCKFQPIVDRGAGPLMAIREHIISRKSLGGIQTDLAGRVQGGNGRAIDGLFAAGEAAGFGGGGMNGKRGLEGSFSAGVYSPAGSQVRTPRRPACISAKPSTSRTCAQSRGVACRASSSTMSTAARRTSARSRTIATALLA